MLNKISIFLFYYLIGMFVCFPVSAHEYWLQPDDFTINSEERINIHIKIGQQFKGNNFAYLPSEIESIEIHLDDKTKPIRPRLGDYPAISYPPLGNGLNIISLESKVFKLNYETSDKFEKFVRNNGLDWVLAEHNRRRLPPEDFIEAYRRHAKTLIQVGNVTGQDRQLGMEFEWVLKSNPYTDTSDEFVAQLWWRGKVFAGSQARLFVKSNDKLTEQLLTTNSDGRVSFKRIPDATYLINAVHMILPEQSTVEETDAVWESRWASLTFATPGDKGK